jgi:two-component system, NtrC family, response regulator
LRLALLDAEVDLSPFFREKLQVDWENSRSGSEEVRARVLVVDDEPLIRWSVMSTLGDAGYEVIEAANAAEAREQAARAGTLEFALLDVRLPDSDGLTLMRAIHEMHPNCRFLMMTAFRTPELTDDADADDVPVLDKPFSLPDLVQHVARLLDEDATSRRYFSH